MTESTVIRSLVLLALYILYNTLRRLFGIQSLAYKEPRHRRQSRAVVFCCKYGRHLCDIKLFLLPVPPPLIAAHRRGCTSHHHEGCCCLGRSRCRRQCVEIPRLRCRQLLPRLDQGWVEEGGRVVLLWLARRHDDGIVRHSPRFPELRRHRGQLGLLVYHLHGYSRHWTFNHGHSGSSHHN